MSEAQRITIALGGDWRAGAGLAPCPVCQPERRRDQRALSITDRGGKLLVHCHKGGCDVFPELQRMGLVEGRAANRQQYDPREAEKRRAEDRKRQVAKLRSAHDLFAGGRSCEGTLAQTYLEARGIVGLRFDKVKRTLRFHPSAWHSPSGHNLPAMIAQIRDGAGRAIGVHRTFLRSDGTGKADAEPAKMILGPSAGGAVRFGPDAKVIVLAEGIETALSITLASRVTVWATLSTSGLKGLVLPPLPAASVVIIAADNDDAGLAAAESAAARFESDGRVVSIIHPQGRGEDFNDVLRGDAK